MSNPFDINDYVANLIAGKTLIQNIYCAVDRSRNALNTNRKFCQHIKVPGVGCKNYTDSCLVALDNKAACSTLQQLLDEFQGKSVSLDIYIVMLLFGRKAIQELYQTQIKALYAKDVCKSFIYTFKSPYGDCVLLLDKKLTFKSSFEFLRFFCESEELKFSPIDVFLCLFSF